MSPSNLRRTGDCRPDGDCTTFPCSRPRYVRQRRSSERPKNLDPLSFAMDECAPKDWKKNTGRVRRDGTQKNETGKRAALYALSSDFARRKAFGEITCSSSRKKGVKSENLSLKIDDF